VFNKRIIIGMTLISICFLSACSQQMAIEQRTGNVIVINNGAAVTSSQLVTLTFSPTIEASEMFISNCDPTYGFPEQSAYTPVKEWYLYADEGTQEVYVQFKDPAGKIYGPFSNKIIYDPVSGEVKLVSKVKTGANRYRIEWINPEGGTTTHISAESNSVLHLSPRTIDGSPFELSSCEVETDGGPFSLSLVSIKDSGLPSPGIRHSFPSGDYLTLTNEVAATSMNIIMGGEIVNNGGQKANGVQVIYSFYNIGNSQKIRARTYVGSLLPGEKKAYMVETSLSHSSWDYYGKYVLYE